MCTSPIEIRQKHGPFARIRVVPCGSCPECTRKKQNAYVVRTLLEVEKRGGPMWFFTLTYANEHLPYSADPDSGELLPSLRRSDVKKMFHDIRQNGTRKGESLPSFAWLYSGEYGPRTYRPHYHGCFIGLPDTFVYQFKEYWEKHYGFTDFKNVPLIDSNGKDNVGCVARYIAKYISKPKEFELDIVNRGLVEKPRKVTSVNFGFPNDEKFKKYHLSGLKSLEYNSSVPSSAVINISDRLTISFGGFHYSMPDYIIKKLFYEKNFNGNLAKSSLFSLVKAYQRSKHLDNFDQVLRKWREEGRSDEWITETIGKILDFQEFSLYVRRDSGIKDLQTFYQKSKF